MNTLVIEPGSTLAYHTGDWRSQRPVFRNKWPPCGQACPASEDIQSWMALASNNEWQAAWYKLCERNPLPAVMGRICYHPCELSCNRENLDSAVNIHGVERYLGDLALQQGWHHRALVENQMTQQVAVIGAGPAGLSCAFQLARRGYPVTIFDNQSVAGGTLYSGIPDYRLPKTVLAQEVNAILKLGIQLRLNTRIGEQLSAESLRKDFDAIFLAIGAQQARIDSIMGDSDHSVVSGVEFLRRINHGETVNVPKNVAIIGGGNTAIDAARCARRLGAEVTVVCPQDPHGVHHGHQGAEIPASVDEVHQAEAEGVRILYRVGIKRLVRSGLHLSGLEIAHVDRLHDRHGDFNPLLFEGTEDFLPADLVIFAIGQTIDWHGMEELIQENTHGIILGGDAAGKPRFAATAVGSGYQGAMCVIASLTGIPPTYEYHDQAEVSANDMHLSYYPLAQRNEAAVAKHWQDQEEIVSGLSQMAAAAEVERCLSCGVCFQCDNCWHFCPDAAVIKNSGDYKIDYDYCKGCAICVQECPSGHIDIVRVLT